MRREPRNGQADAEVDTTSGVSGVASGTLSIKRGAAERVSEGRPRPDERTVFDALGQFTSEEQADAFGQGGTHSSNDAGEREARSRWHPASPPSARRGQGVSAADTEHLDTPVSSPPTRPTVGTLEQALGLYETAMFNSDLGALREGTALVIEMLGGDPDQKDAQLLKERFETLRKMLEASPRADPHSAPPRMTQPRNWRVASHRW